MTLFFDSEENAIIENHPDEWISTDDEGRLIIDFDAAPRDEKVTTLLSAAASAVEASDTYALVTEPTTEWVGDE
jgi:hypothetical protein